MQIYYDYYPGVLPIYEPDQDISWDQHSWRSGLGWVSAKEARCVGMLEELTRKGFETALRRRIKKLPDMRNPCLVIHLREVNDRFLHLAMFAHGKEELMGEPRPFSLCTGCTNYHVPGHSIKRPLPSSI